MPDNLERVSMKTNLDSGQVFNNLLVGASPGLPSITSSVLPAIGSPPPNRILPPSFLDDVLDELDDVTSAKPDTTNESNPANDHFDDKVPSNVHNVKENDDRENNHKLQNGNSYIAIGNESENVIISHHQNEDNELIQNVYEMYITNGIENENTPEDNENDEKLSQKSVYLGGSAPSSGRESQTSLSTHIVMVKPSSCSDNDNDEAVENYNAALDDPCNESANGEKVFCIFMTWKKRSRITISLSIP